MPGMKAASAGGGPDHDHDMTDSFAAELSRLRWRCRRGMQELDVMLGHWLERSWPEATDPLRKDFAALLELEDDTLWDWLSGRVQPEPAFAAIVHVIRDAHFPATGG